MSKSFSKNKSSQHKIYSDTWGAGEAQQHNNLFKLAKPPRRNPQQFMTTQPQYEQSNQQYNNSQANSRKGVNHRRNNSNYLNSQHQSQQYDPLGQFQNYKSQNVTPIKVRRYQSRSRIVQSQASKDIDQRFRQIERIMGQQNQNLRKQKDYLLSNIYKMQAKQKQYKNQLARFKQKCSNLEQQNILLRQKYERAREFISTGIDKMQEVIIKQSQNISNSNTHHSNSNSILVSQQIQQLNDKFDALMYEYQQKNNKSPEIRKKCIEIAKQLRRLRKAEQEGYSYKSGKNSINKNI